MSTTDVKISLTAQDFCFYYGDKQKPLSHHKLHYLSQMRASFFILAMVQTMKFIRPNAYKKKYFHTSQELSNCFYLSAHSPLSSIVLPLRFRDTIFDCMFALRAVANFCIKSLQKVQITVTTRQPTKGHS